MSTWMICDACGWRGVSDNGPSHVCINGDQPRPGAVRYMNEQEAIDEERAREAGWVRAENVRAGR